MGAHFQPVPPAAVSRVLSAFNRDQIASFIEVAIGLLDVADGDSDSEANGDEQDTSWSERPGSGPGLFDGAHEDAEAEPDDEDSYDQEDPREEGECRHYGVDQRGVPGRYNPVVL